MLLELASLKKKQMLIFTLYKNTEIKVVFEDCVSQNLFLSKVPATRFKVVGGQPKDLCHMCDGSLVLPRCTH